jgi:hypothetical protein
MPLRWTAGGLVPDFSDSSDDEEKPCEVCANLDRHSVASWMRTGTNSFYIYDISPSALKAQDGICYTCTMVGGGLSQFRQDWAESDGKLRINVRGRDDYSRPLLVQLAKPAHNDDDDDDDGAIENDKENEDKGDNKGDKNSSPIKAAPVELVMELYADKDGKFGCISLQYLLFPITN